MHTRKRLLRRGVAFEEASKQKSKHAGPSNLTSEVPVVAGKRKGKRSPPASSSHSDCGGSNSSPEREQSQRTKRQEGKCDIKGLTNAHARGEKMRLQSLYFVCLFIPIFI